MSPVRLGERERGGGESAGEVVEVAAVVVEPVADLVGGQGGEQQVGAQVGLGCAGLAEQIAAVLAPETVRAAAEPCPWGGGFRQQYQFELTVEEHEIAGDERAQPPGGVGARPERWRPGQDLLLQLALPLVEQCDGQAAFVAEPPVEGSFAHPGGRGDVVHRHADDTTIGEQLFGGGQHPQPVMGGIGTLVYNADAQHRQLDAARLGIRPRHR